jgi:oligopeptidase B
MKTDKNLLLFKTNMSAGHGGSSGRFQPLKDEALVDAFMLKLAGIKE